MDENIEAIEEEKKEYLENHPDESENSDDEEVEVEETEFSLTEDEVDEWIVKLTELKVEKNPIELEVDEETTLKINFEESSDEDDEEGE